MPSRFPEGAHIFIMLTGFWLYSIGPIAKTGWLSLVTRFKMGGNLGYNVRKA